MCLRLKISCDEISEDALQGLVRDFSMAINRETDCTSILPEEDGSASFKGEVITLGTILISAISSGSLVALFNVFKTFFERKPSLVMEIELSDGSTMKIGAEQLNEKQMDDVIVLSNNIVRRLE